ncbi:MAG: DNA polymerase III subunit beta [Syntrophales bacterium]|nr:DNA polymerase III subunit beta [Syntrophales bacterium]MDD5233502.1 DNA polymerase III subunit beta [Syntrophales bacterium]MDD5532424.1 DNA polymerase III subunit beta [Syntrophales bacterium]
MDFKIRRDVLLDGVQKTLGIVEKRTTMPILNNILLKAGEGRIRIIATNREIVLIADYEAEIAVPGDITVSARKLYEMIREVPAETLHFTLNDTNWITMSSGRIRYRMPGISAEDFPKVDEMEAVPFYRLSAEMIRDLINKTYFAMSTEEMRVNLNGTLIETEKDGDRSRLKLIATDGYRLSVAAADAGSAEFLQLEKGIIVPRKAVGEIRKLVEDEGKEVEIGARKGQCLIRSGNVLLKVNLIESDFPDYRKVVSMDRGTAVELDRAVFIQSLRRMGVISNEKYSGAVLRLTKGKMLLTSTNPDIGEASDEIEIDYNGKEVEAAYNVHYLIDAVEAIDDEKIVFEMRDALKPGTVRPAGPDGYLCVIVALKV